MKNKKVGIPFLKKKEKTDLAKTFEEKDIKKQKIINNLYQVFGFSGLAISFLSLLAIIMMLPLKNTEVEIWTVDKNTGQTEKVSRVLSENITKDEALGRYFVTQYIKNREGYNYFRLQHDYDMVMLWSAENVANEYTALFKTEARPTIVYKKAQRTADIEILYPVFINPSSQKGDPDLLATVRFKKIIKDVTTNRSVEEAWVARMTYRFMPDAEKKESERNANPLGFVVTSFIAEKEIRG
ncbi:virB8 family protein [Providencia rettgeri]